MRHERLRSADREKTCKNSLEPSFSGLTAPVLFDCDDNYSQHAQTVALGLGLQETSPQATEQGCLHTFMGTRRWVSPQL